MSVAGTGQDTRFSCNCGRFSGHVAALSPQSGVHLQCFCADCRAADVYLGQPDPETSGLHIVQVSPSDISIDTGAEHLALLRLYPTGLLRWYAGCCQTPMYNTVATPRLSMVGLRVERLDSPRQAGPVRVKAFVPKPGGKRGHRHAMRMVWPIAVRSLSGLISGDWRDTPFFDPQTRLPVRTPKVLSQSERRELGLGPRTAPG